MSYLATRLRLSVRDADVLLSRIRMLMHETGNVQMAMPDNFQAVIKEESRHLVTNGFRVVDIPGTLPCDEDGQPLVLIPSTGGYQVYVKNILDIAQDLLSEAFSQGFSPRFRYTERGVRQFSELYESDWWANMPTEDVLAFILYADATHVTLRGRMVHPVYMTLGNLPRRMRNPMSGKRLVGFIPVVLPARELKQSEANEVKQFRLQVR